MLIVVTNADGLRGIFNHQQALLARKFHNWGHVAGHAIDVNWHDCFCARSEPRGKMLGANLQCGWVNVAKNGCGPGHFHGAGRAKKSKRRHDNFIPGANVHGAQAEIDGKRAIGCQSGVLDVHQLAEFGNK